MAGYFTSYFTNYFSGGGNQRAQGIYVVPPNGMEFENWANAVIMSMNGIVTSLNAPVADDWHTWANSLVSQSRLQSYGVPQPIYFDRWEDWAAALCNSLGSGGM